MAIGWHCFDIAHERFSSLEANSVNVFRPTQRAPNPGKVRRGRWWESARFQAVCVAWSWLRQSSVLPSRPPAGNASR
jgi:hypothetical protein